MFFWPIIVWVQWYMISISLSNASKSLVKVKTFPQLTRNRYISRKIVLLGIHGGKRTSTKKQNPSEKRRNQTNPILSVNIFFKL